MRHRARLMSMLSALALTMFAVGLSPAPADAQVISARGNGKIPAAHCNLAVSPCENTASGTDYQFNFTGEGPGPGVPVVGTVSIRDSDLSVRVDSVEAFGFISRGSNILVWQGTCQVDNPVLNTVVTGPCNGFVDDQGEPGSNDLMAFTYMAPGAFGGGCCTPASGGAQID